MILSIFNFRMMRKFIIKIILFSTLFLSVNAFYLYVLKRVDWNLNKRTEAINLTEPKNDILVLGNSLAMDGIDAELMTKSGFPTYNLALGGASIRTSEFQLREYLSKYQYKPKLIILGTGSYITNLNNDSIHPIVKRHDFFNVSDLPMIKYRYMFKENLKKIISKPHRSAQLKQGQLRINRVIVDNTRYSDNSINWQKEYENSKPLKNIIHFCYTQNIPIYVFEMPGFKNTRHSINYSVCATLFTGASLYDFNHQKFCKIFDDKRDWLGNSHLNSIGAEKFTAEVIKLLDTISLLGNIYKPTNISAGGF